MGFIGSLSRRRQRLRRRIATLSVAGLLVGLLASHQAALGATPATPNNLPPYLADANDPAVTTLAFDRGLSIEEAQRRIGWQEPAYQLGEALRQALGDRFGGLWFDEAGGGRVKVGLVGNNAAAARALIEQRKLSAVTDLVPVRHSYNDLEAANAWLSAAIATANQGAATRLASSMLVHKNVVQLKLPHGQRLSVAQQQVVDQAKRRLGGAHVLGSWSGRIRSNACGFYGGTFDCDPPLRGGVALYRVNSTAACSTAFYARSRSDGKPYIMTAGHCGGAGSLWNAWQPRTGMEHRVGEMWRRSLRNPPDPDDHGIITIDNPSGWNPRPWVYVHASSSTVEDPDYVITRVSGSSIDMRVCLSGMRTGTDCGTVDEVGFLGPGGYAVVDYCDNPGDSGGAVYSTTAARGIHTGSLEGAPACQGRLYMGVAEAEDDLNVNVVRG
jgi:streptogrisin C